MALPKYYAAQQCSLARSLEIVGERWTLLIVRDAFFGVRRFGDFLAHLGMSRAVLTERLEGLLETGVLAETPGSHGYREYVLTGKGVDLWPVVRDLLAWGNEHCSENGPRRVFRHVPDSGLLAPDGSCTACGRTVAPADLVVLPGPGYDDHADDFVSEALSEAHRLLEPLRTR
ncbi:helix-turn-helix domain-containing protein [Amycolatopsis sp. DSM 110486]|uniref:winged helix-turn-helix transcriptional regulator n=1 Tax=Amycolatopsis sp. DSM 110486 TaxID=2865832 RepID=UPI001C69BD37|nr:helix-turn-helix domain-containing protein [Amycolatopsis sp. DSM 110486]QYN21435.1 helix-turn-helix transcriptional regulator [Amycolatopsis sp. DSM 110486]